jgi:hypothetical protein
MLFENIDYTYYHLLNLIRKSACAVQAPTPLEITKYFIDTVTFIGIFKIREGIDQISFYLLLTKLYYASFRQDLQRRKFL